MSLLRWGFKRQHGCDRGANKHYCITVMTTVTTYNVSKQHFIYLKFTQCYKTNRSIKTTKIFKRHTHTHKKKPAVCLLALSRSLALGEGKPCHEEPYIKKWCGKKRKPPIYSYMCAVGAGAPTRQVYWNYSPSWASWLNPHEGHWARLLPDPQKPLS